ncbi:chromosomal replication initiator protein DnaA [Candidatus Gracilibacteria bacterium]|nr:chromosomal replication initiator protein DnaA [Candidatus Gracilibacteria bacterium]
MDKVQVWDAVLTRMSEKISRMEFHTWFKKVRISEISGGAVLLSCPTEMNKNWLETKYHGMILQNIKAILPEIDKIFFNVDLTLADSPSATPQAFEKAKAPRKLPNQPDVKLTGDLKSRIVHSKFTLGNFVVGEETKLAHAACMAVTESGSKEKKKYNPLFVYGGVGLGKTHLLQGTANEIIRRNPDAIVVYTTSERFINEIVDAIRNRKGDELRKKYRRVDALILDDVQFFEGKEKTQEELFNTFNDLFEFNKQIIFSADRPPSELVGISDRLRSRMGWGLSVDVQMPGYETRLAIVQEKSKELKLVLPNDVQEFIAANVRKSLRELENILNQISAEVELSEMSPTIQSVGKMFRKLNPSEELETSDGAKAGFAKSPDEIITAVSEYFQVPATELLGNSRKQGIVFPRQIAWTLCKDILRMSHESIGKDFGGKNHTTIMHGIRKISGLKRKDSTTARHIHALRKDLGVK